MKLFKNTAHFFFLGIGLNSSLTPGGVFSAPRKMGNAADATALMAQTGRNVMQRMGETYIDEMQNTGSVVRNNINHTATEMRGDANRVANNACSTMANIEQQVDRVASDICSSSAEARGALGTINRGVDRITNDASNTLAVVNSFLTRTEDNVSNTTALIRNFANNGSTLANELRERGLQKFLETSQQVDQTNKELRTTLQEVNRTFRAYRQLAEIPLNVIKSLQSLVNSAASFWNYLEQGTMLMDPNLYSSHDEEGINPRIKEIKLLNLYDQTIKQIKNDINDGMQSNALSAYLPWNDHKTYDLAILLESFEGLQNKLLAKVTSKIREFIEQAAPPYDPQFYADLNQLIKQEAANDAQFCKKLEKLAREQIMSQLTAS